MMCYFRAVYELLGNGDSYDHLKENLLLSPEVFVSPLLIVI